MKSESHAQHPHRRFCSKFRGGLHQIFRYLPRLLISRLDKRHSGLLAVVALSSLASTSLAQTATQEFNLRAGWNAIWLEVEPSRTEIGAVFTNLPIFSVWTYVPNGGTVQFIRDQN